MEPREIKNICMLGRLPINRSCLLFFLLFFLSCKGPQKITDSEKFGPPEPKIEQRVIHRKKSISLVIELKDGPQALILLGLLKNYRSKISVDLYVTEASLWVGTAALCSLPTNRFEWEWFRSKFAQRLQEAPADLVKEVQNQWVKNLCRSPSARRLPVSLHTTPKEDIPWLTHPEWLRVRVGPASIAGEDCKFSIESNSTAVEYWSQKAEAESIGKAIIEKLNRCVEEWGMS